MKQYPRTSTVRTLRGRIKLKKETGIFKEGNKKRGIRKFYNLKVSLHQGHPENLPRRISTERETTNKKEGRYIRSFRGGFLGFVWGGFFASREKFTRDFTGKGH